MVYGGIGNDFVSGGHRVYGGPGRDELDGARVYGGPGADSVYGDVATYIRGPVVLRGGPGDDGLDGPGSTYGGGGAARLYGGRGDDVLNTWDGEPAREMLVGGPGRDAIHLGADELGPDNRSDVVRVRGGGVDRVDCGRRAERKDTLFVDRSDRLSTSCEDATVSFTGRPR